jgi:hypothetical protein
VKVTITAIALLLYLVRGPLTQSTVEPAILSADPVVRQQQHRR